jgi:hypothetical protein
LPRRIQKVREFAVGLGEWPDCAPLPRYFGSPRTSVTSGLMAVMICSVLVFMRICAHRAATAAVAAVLTLSASFHCVTQCDFNLLVLLLRWMLFAGDGAAYKRSRWVHAV